MYPRFSFQRSFDRGCLFDGVKDKLDEQAPLIDPANYWCGMKCLKPVSAFGPKERLTISVASLLAILLSILCFAGCRSITVKEQRSASTGIETGESVTIVLNFSGDLSMEETQKVEEKYGRCIADALKRKNPEIRFVPAGKFRTAVFPGLDFASSPRTPGSYRLLLDNPGFQERIVALGIRYLVIVGGSTETQHDFGDILCGAGYGGGGCFGLKVWKKTSALAGVIIDFKKSRTAGEVSATVTGKSWFAVLGILPLGMPTFTESRACDELGESVGKFLVGTSPAQ